MLILAIKLITSSGPDPPGRDSLTLAFDIRICSDSRDARSARVSWAMSQVLLPDVSVANLGYLSADFRGGEKLVTWTELEARIRVIACGNRNRFAADEVADTAAFPADDVACLSTRPLSMKAVSLATEKECSANCGFPLRKRRTRGILFAHTLSALFVLLDPFCCSANVTRDTTLSRKPRWSRLPSRNA